jgi:hypothetical protein
MRFRTKFKSKVRSSHLFPRKKKSLNKRSLPDSLVSIHKSSSKRKLRKILKITLNY